MEHFWTLTYLGSNDRIGVDRFDDEDEAREAWSIADRPLFLDEVWRIQSRF